MLLIGGGIMKTFNISGRIFNFFILFILSICCFSGCAMTSLWRGSPQHIEKTDYILKGKVAGFYVHKSFFDKTKPLQNISAMYSQVYIKYSLEKTTFPKGKQFSYKEQGYLPLFIPTKDIGFFNYSTLFDQAGEITTTVIDRKINNLSSTINILVKTKSPSTKDSYNLEESGYFIIDDSCRNYLPSSTSQELRYVFCMDGLKYNEEKTPFIENDYLFISIPADAINELDISVKKTKFILPVGHIILTPFALTYDIITSPFLLLILVIGPPA
jgi:hypothetical protein